MKTVLALFILSVTIAAAYVSYEGYKVFRLDPSNKEQFDIIQNFSQNDLFDFWSRTKVVGIPTIVMVAPDAQTAFVKTLETAYIPYTVTIENVESVVQKERNRQLTVFKYQGDKIDFNAYNRYQTIQNYLEELAENYPDIVSLEDIGSSYEGRKMTMIKIGTGANDNPTILIDAGIHAREWISPAFALYLIRELVENKNNSMMIKNVNWFVVPVLNPDGYEYSHTTDRFWRKTRSLGVRFQKTRCEGVDPNRNFDFHWKEAGGSSDKCDPEYAGPSAFSESETSALRDTVHKYSDQIKLYIRLWRKTRSRSHGVDGNRNFDYKWMVTGASSDERSEEFARPAPFSEPETAAFRDYALALNSIDLYLAIHSHGQYILYPWGWTSALPDNADQLHALGFAVGSAIYAVAGTRYTVGSASNVLPAAAGASDDWVFAIGRAPLSYTVELPGGGSYGFDLPASRILPVVQETWQGIRVYHEYVATNATKKL